MCMFVSPGASAGDVEGIAAVAKSPSDEAGGAECGLGKFAGNWPEVPGLGNGVWGRVHGRSFLSSA